MTAAILPRVQLVHTTYRHNSKCSELRVGDALSVRFCGPLHRFRAWYYYTALHLIYPDA